MAGNSGWTIPVFRLHYIDLFLVVAIATASIILMRPALLTRSVIVRYMIGAALLILGVAHLFGFALLSMRFP